jgi:hypothetical protein
MRASFQRLPSSVSTDGHEAGANQHGELLGVALVARLGERLHARLAVIFAQDFGQIRG